VFNDGRNFLLTTEERYDVLTADPIHPWSQGAAYLYTDEYYRLAASRLRPGGVMCQWLPIYELSPLDLQSVVKTFANNFKYVYVWLTDSDAELLGSNEPIEIDIDELQQRIDANPRVKADLQKVNMGSAANFLSYCIMGPEGSRLFGQNAPLNTDNNLYLEFSAPDSKGKPELIAVNINALRNYREDLGPYLTGQTLPEAFAVDPATFNRAVAYYDRAHLLHYQGRDRSPDYSRLMATIEENFSWFGPNQFLLAEYDLFQLRVPRLLEETRLALRDASGQPTEVVLSAVVSKMSRERAKLFLLDNRVRKVFASLYVDSSAKKLDQAIAEQAAELLRIVTATYRAEQQNGGFPDRQTTLQKIERALKNYAQQRP
jgi:spermidine synthase